MPKSILLIYHFFQPDPVISARLFAELAEELERAGHGVTVFTGNRLIRSDEKLPPREVWNGVEIRRFSRPNFSQGSNVGRLFNSGILHHFFYDCRDKSQNLPWLFSFYSTSKIKDLRQISVVGEFSHPEA